jgi:hypothetical protein
MDENEFSPTYPPVKNEFSPTYPPVKNEFSPTYPPVKPEIDSAEDRTGHYRLKLQR